MRPLRKSVPPQQEMWGKKEIMNHLNCDEMKAKRIFTEVCEKHNLKNYAEVPKEYVLDYLAEKERIQREREMRYKSDLSNVESIGVLKEQVKTLKEMSRASSEDARQARTQSKISNVLSLISMLIAAGSMVIALLAFLH